MTRANAAKWWCSAVIAVLVLASCGPRRQGAVTYHDPNMDFSMIQTVAVMPFENLTPEGSAAERVRDTFTVMLQATGSVYVLPPGEVARGIQRTTPRDPTRPTPEEVGAITRVVGADVVITGTVREYGAVRSGSTSANTVSVSLEMMEGETGRVVWSGASTKGGVSTADRVFGGGGRPMDIVTSKAVQDLLNQLFE
jgi:hypothetical protein